MKEIVTVFTPTYNRRSTLIRLYNSLCMQTNNMFRWLIVDDGSTDNTESLVQEWINDKKVNIKYFKQKNEGKSMAHNKGVENTDTELFVCVDSDDCLVPDAIEKIVKTWEKVKQKKYIGIVAYRGTYDGENISKCKFEIESSTLIDAYRKYGFKGDSMLVYKTALLKKYCFPHFTGEKFVPESYLYDKLDQEGKLYFIHKVLYLCEYLQDGYTNNMRMVIKNNPRGYIEYINQRIAFDKSVFYICADSIRYIAVAKCNKASNKEIVTNAVYPLITTILLPLGVFYFHKLYKSL